MPDGALQGVVLFIVLLNPFMMVVYLLDLVEQLDARTFAKVLARGATISLAVFIAFALTGDRVFTDVFQVRFASFLVFGGVVFLVLGLQLVFKGRDALAAMRGPPEHIAGAIAMPFMIGPGTVSAAVLVGAQQSSTVAVVIVTAGIVITVLLVVVLKTVHDAVRKRNAELVNRYIELVGRASALIIGTIAVEMVARGVETFVLNAP